MSENFIAGTQISRDEAKAFVADLVERQNLLRYPDQFDSTIALLSEAVISNTPDSSVEAWQKISPTESYTSQLELIRERVVITEPVLFVPGHGPDLSHYKAFYDAKRIINLDPNPLAVNLHRDLTDSCAEVECQLGLIETFKPEEPVDVIFATNVCFDPQWLRYPGYLREGGLIITNSGSPDFDSDPNLTFRGTTIMNREFFSEQPQPDVSSRQIYTERELMLCGPANGQQFADYGHVYGVVYDIDLRTDNLITRYRDIRERAVEDMLDAIRIGQVSQEELAEQLPLSTSRHEFKRADIFTEQGRSFVRQQLLKFAVITFKRNLKDYTLPPLPIYHEGVTRRDLSVWEYRPRPSADTT